MHKTRLEAFSDGVIAIIITIMVLELEVPHAAAAAALRAAIPPVLVYLLSFVFLGIYWNNHHHMLHATERVNGKVLWANLHLLFWLSLFPFCNAWIVESHFASLPVAVFGLALLAAALSYTMLQVTILRLHGPESRIAQAIGSDTKGKLSLLLYVLAVPLAFVHPGIAGAIYVIVALIWLVPDRRIESRVYGSA